VNHYSSVKLGKQCDSDHSLVGSSADSDARYGYARNMRNTRGA
jgi:hypothetical protein